MDLGLKLSECSSSLCISTGAAWRKCARKANTYRTLTPSISILITQLIGAPLYFYNKDYYYAWMAVTKQHFGLVVTTMTYWWAPVKMRISGDESVRGQLRKTEDGTLECDFPERMLLIANHEVRHHHVWGISVF